MSFSVGIVTSGCLPLPNQLTVSSTDIIDNQFITINHGRPQSLVLNVYYDILNRL